jgi:hypothetical protein
MFLRQEFGKLKVFYVYVPNKLENNTSPDVNMGQRHNRRRTRPRSRNRAASLDSVRSSVCPFDYAASSPVGQHSEPAVLAPFAHTRHTWLEEWQRSECTESVDADQLVIQQQYRYFGGEPGDDENLCYNMLDYFGRLDYINT